VPARDVPPAPLSPKSRLKPDADLSRFVAFPRQRQRTRTKLNKIVSFARAVSARFWPAKRHSASAFPDTLTVNAASHSAHSRLALLSQVY
jgi:hypothetical protein